MKKPLCAVAMVCALAGGSFFLPRSALAQPSPFPTCTTLETDGGANATYIVYGISEASGSEIANCDIGASSSLRSGQTPVAGDLLEPAAPGTPGSFSSSDHLTITRFASGSSHTVVTFVSDAGEGPAENQVLSTLTIDSPDNQPETATCTFTTGLLTGKSFFGNCFDLGTDLASRQVGLVAQSDVEATIPEPSTALLLGSVLPALLVIRQRTLRRLTGRSERLARREQDPKDPNRRSGDHKKDIH